MSSISLPSRWKRMESRFNELLLWQSGSFLKRKGTASSLWVRRSKSLTSQAFSTETHEAGREDRRDADFERMKVYANTIAPAKKKWFDDVYGARRLHLRILGTHPDYQGRGAATQHCRWGMELAREHKVPITLLSGPMGQRLYSHLGFLILASVTVQVEGEEEKMSIGLMVYKGFC